MEKQAEKAKTADKPEKQAEKAFKMPDFSEWGSEVTIETVKDCKSFKKGEQYTIGSETAAVLIGKGLAKKI